MERRLKQHDLLPEVEALSWWNRRRRRGHGRRLLHGPAQLLLDLRDLVAHQRDPRLLFRIPRAQLDESRLKTGELVTETLNRRRQGTGCRWPLRSLSRTLWRRGAPPRLHLVL